MSSIDELGDLRKSIDNIDIALIALLAERFTLTEKVGSIKAEFGLPAEDAMRESQQKEKYVRLASEHHLAADTVLQVMQTIVGLVKRRHLEIGAARHK